MNGTRSHHRGLGLGNHCESVKCAGRHRQLCVGDSHQREDRGRCEEEKNEGESASADVHNGIVGGMAWHNRWCMERGRRRDEERWILAMLRGDLAGLCFLALGSEGEGGAGMTQS